MWKKTVVASMLAVLAGTSAFGFTVTIGHIQRDDQQVDLKYPLVYLQNEPNVPQEMINKDIASFVYFLLNDYNTLAASASSYEGGFKAQVSLDYKVVYHDGHYLSLILYPYIYSGGAHGMSYTFGRVYDLSTGETVPLRYFIPNWGPNYLREGINDGRFKFVNSHGEDAEVGEFQSINAITNDTYYIQDEHTLVAVFQPYAMGPYSDGAIKAFIPFDLEAFEAEAHKEDKQDGAYVDRYSSYRNERQTIGSLFY